MKWGAEGRRPLARPSSPSCSPKSPIILPLFPSTCVFHRVYLWTFELSAGVATWRAGQLLSEIVKGDLWLLLWYTVPRLESTCSIHFEDRFGRLVWAGHGLFISLRQSLKAHLYHLEQRALKKYRQPNLRWWAWQKQGLMESSQVLVCKAAAPEDSTAPRGVCPCCSPHSVPKPRWAPRMQGARRRSASGTVRVVAAVLVRIKVHVGHQVLHITIYF